MERCGHALSDEQAAQLVESLDRDGDGFVSFTDFVEGMGAFFGVSADRKTPSPTPPPAAAAAAPKSVFSPVRRPGALPPVTPLRNSLSVHYESGSGSESLSPPQKKASAGAPEQGGDSDASGSEDEMHLSSMISSDPQISEYQQLFQQLDTDADGELSRDDIKGALKGISEAQLDTVMNSLDTNLDGTINFNEFVEGIAQIDQLVTQSQQRVTETPPASAEKQSPEKNATVAPQNAQAAAQPVEEVLADLRQKNAALQTCLEAAQKDLNASAQNNGHLKRVLSGKEAELQKLKEALDDNEVLRFKNSELVTLMQKLQKDIATLTTQNKSLQRDSKTLIDMTQSLQDKKTQMEGDLAQLKLQLSVVSHAKQALEEEIVQLQGGNVDEAAAIKSLKEQIQHLEVFNKKLQNDLSTNAALLEDARSDLRHAQESAKTSEGESEPLFVENLEADFVALKKRHADLEESFEMQNEVLDKLKEDSTIQILRVEQKLQKVAADAEKAEAEVKQHREEKQRLAEEKQRLEMSLRQEQEQKQLVQLELKQKEETLIQELRTQLQACDTERGHVMSRLKECEAEAAALTSKLTERDAEKEELTLQLKLKAEEAAALTSQLKEHESQKQELTSQLREKEAALAALQAEATTAGTERGEVTSQLKEREADVAVLKVRAQELMLHMKEKEAEVVALTSQLREKEAQAQEIGSQLKEKEKEATVLREQLKNLEAERGELTSRLKEKESEGQQLASLLKKKESETAELVSQLKEREAQTQQLTSELNAREAHAQELASRLKNYETEVVTLTSQLEQEAKLTSRLQEREASAATLASQLKEKDAQVQELTSQLKEHEAVAQELTSRLKEHEVHAQQLVTQLEEADARTKTLGEEREKLQQAMAMGQATETEKECILAQLQQQLSDAKAATEASRKDGEEKSGQLAEQAAALTSAQTERDALQERVNTLDVEVSSVKAERDKVEERIKNLDVGMSSVKEERDQLLERFKELEDGVCSVKEERDQLQSRTKALEDEASSVKAERDKLLDEAKLAKAEVEQLQVRNKEMKVQLELGATSEGEKAAQLARLHQQELQDAQSKVGRAEERAAALEKRLAEKDADLERKALDLAAVEEEASQLAAAASRAKGEAESENANAAALEKRLAEQEAELGRKQHALAAAEEKAAQLAKLRCAQEEAERGAAQVLAASENSKASQEQVAGALAEANSKIVALERQAQVETMEKCMYEKEASALSKDWEVRSLREQLAKASGETQKRAEELTAARVAQLENLPCRSCQASQQDKDMMQQKIAALDCEKQLLAKQADEARKQYEEYRQRLESANEWEQRLAASDSLVAHLVKVKGEIEQELATLRATYDAQTSPKPDVIKESLEAEGTDTVKVEFSAKGWHTVQASLASIHEELVLLKKRCGAGYTGDAAAAGAAPPPPAAALEFPSYLPSALSGVLADVSACLCGGSAPAVAGADVGDEPRLLAHERQAREAAVAFGQLCCNELGTARQNVATLSGQVVQLETDLADCRKTLDAAKKQHKQQVDEWLETEQKWEAECKRLNEVLDSEQEQHGLTRERLAAVEAKLMEQAEEEQTSLPNKVKKMKEKATELEMVNKQLRKQCTFMATRLSEVERQYAKLVEKEEKAVWSMRDFASEFSSCYEKFLHMREHLTLEEEAYVKYINEALHDDVDLRAKHLPMSPVQADVASACVDGVLFCKLINAMFPGTIEERCIRKKVNTKDDVMQNYNLAYNSALFHGITLSGLHTALLKGDVPSTMRLCAEIIHAGSLAKVSFARCKELLALMDHSETLTQFVALPPEELLLRWLNYHLHEFGSKQLAKNFTSDMADGSKFAVVLHQANPTVFNVDPWSERDIPKRLAVVHARITQLIRRQFFSVDHLSNPSATLNTVILSHMFATRHGLKLPSLSAIPNEPLLVELPEHRCLRLWMRALGLQVNHLLELYDGTLLLQLLDKLRPGVVDPRFLKKPKLIRKSSAVLTLERFNHLIALAPQFHLDLGNLQGKDFAQGDRSHVVTLLWHLMKYTITQNFAQEQFGGQRTDEDELVRWCNRKVRNTGRDTWVQSLRDESIADCKFLFDLLRSVDMHAADEMDETVLSNTAAVNAAVMSKSTSQLPAPSTTLFGHFSTSIFGGTPAATAVASAAPAPAAAAAAAAGACPVNAIVARAARLRLANEVICKVRRLGCNVFIVPEQIVAVDPVAIFVLLITLMYLRV
eukprot:TRINITY_DN1652_c0_g1_i8.p1 TRINITY_DN1652_c0_g1~~TRINITY_DN1652_c0_g1_i8.p1  ORF type:complete len:2288 (-),score=848.32 TRINITY_DN1652_c0_g1_i8:37-6702(-)